jgi:hypothetical protein
VRPPTITLSALVVPATAPANGSQAPAAFPDWALADNLGTAGVTVACTANLTGEATPVNVTSGVTPFPVGTTAVSCVASDGALNPSPPAMFSVVVGCGAGYEFRDGKCTGEREGRGTGGTGQCACLRAAGSRILAGRCIQRQGQ